MSKSSGVPAKNLRPGPYGHLEILGILAMILQDIGRPDEALSLSTMMVDSCEQVHGKDSPKTLCWREFAERTAERIKERGAD